jgi:hypothetical protein
MTDLEEAEDYLGESIKILEEVADDYELARSHLILALVHKDEGKHELVYFELDQCMPVFERLEAQLDLAIAQELRRQLQ